MTSKAGNSSSRLTRPIPATTRLTEKVPCHYRDRGEFHTAVVSETCAGATQRRSEAAGRADEGKDEAIRTPIERLAARRIGSWLPKAQM